MSQETEFHIARLLKEMLQEKRKEVEDLEKRWAEANSKARGPWVSDSFCTGRSIVDGWQCCLQPLHEGDHETAGGYKFKASR